MENNVLATTVVEIVSDAKAFEQGLVAAKGKLDKFGIDATKALNNIRNVSAGIFAAGVAGIVSMVNKGAEWETQIGQAVATLKTLGLETEKNSEKIGDLADEFERYGYKIEDTVSSYNRFLLKMGDADKAYNATSAALELANASGQSLSKTTKALISAYDGSYKALGDFDSELVDSIKKAEAQGQTIDYTGLLLEKFGGRAADAAKDTQGAWTNLKDNLDDFQRDLGTLLLPMANRVMDAVSKLTEWFVNLDDSTKQNIVTGILWTTGISGVVAAVSQLIIWIAKLREAWLTIKSLDLVNYFNNVRLAAIGAQVAGAGGNAAGGLTAGEGAAAGAAGGTLAGRVLSSQITSAVIKYSPAALGAYLWLKPGAAGETDAASMYNEILKYIENGADTGGIQAAIGELETLKGGKDYAANAKLILETKLSQKYDVKTDIGLSTR